MAATATVHGLSEKQQAMRAEGLGASEVPIALGLSPFCTAAELVAVKRHEMLPKEGSEATRWGQRLEASIAENWLDEHRSAGEDVSIFRPPTVRHPRCALLMATADRIVVPEGRRARTEWRGLLEVKNLSAWKRDLLADDEELPEAWLVQTQAQLECLDLEDGWLAALVGGNQYIEREFTRDRDLGKDLVEFVEQFWRRHVVEGQAVEVDGSEASSDFLRRRFPRETKPALPATEELRELVQALRLAKAALKEKGTAEAELSNRLRALIGEAAGVEGLCTFRANKPSEKVDWERMAREVHQLLALLQGTGRILGEPLKSFGPWEEMLKKFTTTKPGARVLRLAKGE